MAIIVSRVLLQAKKDTVHTQHSTIPVHGRIALLLNSFFLNKKIKTGRQVALRKVCVCGWLRI